MATVVSPTKDVQKKMKKELAGVYREIVSLSKVISALLKGEEPNMQALLGEPPHEEPKPTPTTTATATASGTAPDNELSLEDLETLTSAIASIRTNLCDYYADKFSNECNVQ